MNDVNNLNIKKIKRFLPEDESEKYGTDRPYSIKEIERILQKCDVRSRVVILLMASSGMRIGALPGLRVGDIKRTDEYGLYMIWVYNRSAKYRHFTCCTPECAIAIDAYLDCRSSFKEEIKDKSLLIREQFNIDDDLRIQYPRFLSMRMLALMYEEVLRRSGVNQVQIADKRRQVMKTHGMRKHFLSQCDRSNLNYTVRERLVGAM